MDSNLKKTKIKCPNCDSVIEVDSDALVLEDLEVLSVLVKTITFIMVLGVLIVWFAFISEVLS
jgi:hypothetical protein